MPIPQTIAEIESLLTLATNATTPPREAETAAH